jgi:hypothetical protein
MLPSYDRYHMMNQDDTLLNKCFSFILRMHEAEILTHVAGTRDSSMPSVIFRLIRFLSIHFEFVSV